MSRSSVALALACALVVPACLTSPAPPPIPTPSGRPECTVPNVPPAEVRAYCLDLFLADGWALHSQSESELIFRKKVTTHSFDFSPMKEVWLVFNAKDGGTHVAGYRVSVSQPGNPKAETRHDPSGGQADYDLWSEVVRHIPERFAAR